MLATGGMGGPIQLLDVATRKKVVEINQRFILVQAFSMTNDGSRAAVADAGDQFIQIWDVAKGKPSVTLVGGERPVISAAFSPDGKRVAASFRDGRIMVWFMTPSKLPWPGPWLVW
jgi:WD40 repeat protein